MYSWTPQIKRSVFARILRQFCQIKYIYILYNDFKDFEYPLAR